MTDDLQKKIEHIRRTITDRELRANLISIAVADHERRIEEEATRAERRVQAWRELMRGGFRDR